MVKKPTAVKKSKSSVTASLISGIEASISQGSAKLSKAYPKSLADVERAFKQAVQELKKAKVASKKAKSTKSKSAKKAAPVNFSVLEKAVANLKSEKSALQAGHKKFLAMQKVVQQFEKSWAKKLKVTSKAKKSPKKKGAKKATSNKSGILSNLMHSAGM